MVKTEGGGILSWMVAGCLEWQRHGLQPPDAVKKATENYLENQDVRQAWFDQRCVRNPQAKTLSSFLFADWKLWAERRNEYVGSQKEFTDHFESHYEFKRRKTRNGMEWIGVALATGREDQPPNNEEQPADTEPI